MASYTHDQPNAIYEKDVEMRRLTKMNITILPFQCLLPPRNRYRRKKSKPAKDTPITQGMKAFSMLNRTSGDG
jgi:hypothetical protein